LNRTIRGTERQAQQWLHRVLHEISTGTFTEPPRQTLAEFLADWLASVARPLEVEPLRRNQQPPFRVT
jgi:hypothetical protein